MKVLMQDNFVKQRGNLTTVMITKRIKNITLFWVVGYRNKGLPE